MKKKTQLTKTNEFIDSGAERKFIVVNTFKNKNDFKSMT